MADLFKVGATVADDISKGYVDCHGRFCAVVDDVSQREIS